MVSDASDEGTRHLALVFFDVLMVDSSSLLYRPYSHRRSILESLINQRPGYAMLSERTAIDMGCRNEARDELTCVFANTIAAHEEGLVLKAEESKYGDWKLPWVKVCPSVAIYIFQEMTRLFDSSNVITFPDTVRRILYCLVSY